MAHRRTSEKPATQVDLGDRMKRSLNDFAGFDKALSKRRWLFKGPDGRTFETAEEHWFPARQRAASELGCEPNQLEWKEIT